MANFATHVAVAGMVATGMASGIAVTGMLSWSDSLILGVFLVAGTLLPDIDVDGGRPQRWLFSLLALAAAIVASSLTTRMQTTPLFTVPGQTVSCEAIAAGFLVWLLIRYPAAYLFQRLTRHRGLCHSLVVGGLWGLGWVYLGLQCLASEPLTIWLQGMTLFLGFLVHLVLDEAYSVDINNARIKRSFGSALKIWEPDFPVGSLLATAALMGLVWLLPYPHELIQWLHRGVQLLG
ncbi:metal-dependent hydrolase [Ectothiorhodospira lacustris]|uniref:metal-dependent hydrolase n=1 Tax=Ectothiorhodospira lacustris TaxID=2899127 RepID=UPI001EE877C8|nr:metal-dependent hydrolase [Ectothiorhodospira lacustris]MCG5510256.1 metal-dependent hydrolase [Ectothiorhodospira lacustris]MCG5521877.1 metal-dependent hydrolase [Ectothiorhodospira lacustris]